MKGQENLAGDLEAAALCSVQCARSATTAKRSQEFEGRIELLLAQMIAAAAAYSANATQRPPSPLTNKPALSIIMIINEPFLLLRLRLRWWRPYV